MLKKLLEQVQLHQDVSCRVAYMLEKSIYVNNIPAAKSWVLVFKPANLMRIGADLVRQASCKSCASSQKHQRQVKNVQNACKRTCTMLSHEQHRNAAFEMEHTLSIPENVSSTFAPFLGSDLIQQNHRIHLGITAIGVPYDHSSALESKVSEICKIMAMAGHRERARPKSSPEPLP